MTSDPPTWSALPLRCKCGHQWTDWQPSNCRINVWVAVINLLVCPKCGADIGSLFLTGDEPGFGTQGDGA